MNTPDVETRVTRTSNARITNGRESAVSSSVSLAVGPRTSGQGFTLLHLAEMLEQAMKLGAPMDTPVYALTHGISEPLRPVAVRAEFSPEARPEAAGEVAE